MRGRVLASLALELAGEDATVRERLREIFEDQVELVHAALAGAVDDGSAPATAADAVTARAVIAQLEGMIIRPAGERSGLIDAAWPQVERLLSATTART